MARPGVLFDVDGTLVDTTYVHVMAWHHVFVEYGVVVAMRRIHQLIGMGAEDLVAEAAGRTLDGAADRHLHHYRRVRDTVDPLRGAFELLTRVHELGLGVVLASSAKQDDVDHAIDVIGARQVIDASTSTDDADEAKPAPDILESAVDKGGLDPASTVAVGDSTWDVKAAARLDIPTIALLSGGIPEPDLRGAGAAEVYDDPAHLLSGLASSRIGALIAG